MGQVVEEEEALEAIRDAIGELIPPVEYIVIVGDKVVERILASTADEAIKKQTLPGQLYVKVGG